MSTWRSAGPDPLEREPRRVAESLDLVSRSIGAPRAQTLASVFSNWELLVGGELADHAQPQSLRDGVLTLLVDQPAWATQLRYLTGEILGRIRTASDEEEVREIRIRVSGEPPPSRRRGARTGPESSWFRANK